MAAPSTPTNFLAQTGNGQNYLSWDLTATATSYQVQRSTNGVSYAVIDSPTTPEYLDTAVTVGTKYYYKVAATNGDGTSSYTSAQTLVPAPTGEMCLGQIRVAAQQRADMVNSNFVSKAEWNSYINQSMYELYDLLITIYEDYYIAEPLSITTTGGTDTYALPNGTNHNGARPFYKLIGVDMGQGASGGNGWVTLKKFVFADRNKYYFPNAGSVLYGVFNAAYRVMGSNIQFIPTPSANQTMRLWYIPRLNQLLADTDLTDTGISGWLEYVITDAAIKAGQKEETDVSVLIAQKMALKKRIEETASSRDAGMPETISDTRGAGGDRGTGWGNGPVGGW